MMSLSSKVSYAKKKDMGYAKKREKRRKSMLRGIREKNGHKSVRINKIMGT
jgi:predicted nucleic acid-binding Zn ribbon protein